MGDPVSSPSIDHSVLYAFDDHELVALDATGTMNCAGTPKTCAPLWTSDARGAFPLETAGVAVTGGVVYAGTAGTTPGQPVGIAAVANGVIHATDKDGISAVDAHGSVNCSGVPRVCLAVWTAAGQFGASNPSVVNGRVYVGGTDGLHVFAQP